jgi:hypothetical protein
MLFRMYTRWGERKGFDVKILDYAPAEEAGIKEEAENIEKKVEEMSAGVTVPGNLLSCPQKYFGTEITDCRTQPQEAVCAYYKIEKGGVERVDNGQHTSECGACKFYGKDGKIEAAGITLIGYEKGECYQGMYGKN